MSSQPLTTVPPSTNTETSKTDITDEKLSNHDFLEVVFNNRGNGCKPFVVNLWGNPASSRSWQGEVWAEGQTSSSQVGPDTNNYFSLAAFSPDESGRYKRRKVQFDMLPGIMLDDIGTKVKMEALKLTPSWLIETSAGNYQAGYLLIEPIKDVRVADRLMQAIITAGLCDPGAGGPSTRLARLPVGINGKRSPAFHCRLATWNPELRYSLQELATGLQLDLAPVTKMPGSHSPNGDLVWIGRPTENPVIATLKQRGLYKRALDGRKHDITCPWHDEHTDGVDHGTAYFEPDEQHPAGGFKCLHGHCEHRHIHELLQHLEIEPSAARMLPTIRIIAGEMPRIIDAAEYELAQSGMYYQRGGLLVTVVTDPGTHELRVHELTPLALQHALAAKAVWERYDARRQTWVRADPPAKHASMLLESGEYKHLPVLSGLARQPYLRSDGELVVTSGYDPETKMFGVFDAERFSIPNNPTRDDALAALGRLIDLLSEFKFASASDLSAALSALLTAVTRPSLPNAPMFHVRAHMPGSGKSYLCQVITSFATAQKSMPTTFPGDDEECRKFLLAELLHSPAVIEFDNLTSDLVAHKSLCTTLSSEFLSGRILGVSKTATVDTRTLFLSSGNNVGPVQDMARRCISIHLDPGCEMPASRRFQHPDLIQELMDKREEFVSAALTIIRAWIAAGQPRTDCPPVNGFSLWSDLCRQPLLWLGFEDPAISVFHAIKDDPDRETLSRLLHAWKAVFGQKPAMIRDAMDRILPFNTEASELREVIHDIADERGEVNRRRLGRWIRRHAGQIVDGLRFVRAARVGSAESWYVEELVT